LISAAAVAVFALPPTRAGTVYWTGDFSTGDWSQYNGMQFGNRASPVPTNAFDARTQVNGNTAAILQSAITRPGYPYAVKFEAYNPNDVQNISAPGVAGGSFTLTWQGSTSTQIAYNATRATVESILNSMPSVQAAGGVTVHGMDYRVGGVEYLLGSTIVSPYNVTMDSKYYISFNTPGTHTLFTADSTNLSGGTVVVAQGDDTAVWAYPHKATGMQHWGGGNANHTNVGDDTYYGFSLYVPSSNIGHWDGAWAIFWDLISLGWGDPIEFNVLSNGHGGSSLSNPILNAQWRVNEDGSFRNVYPMQYEWLDTTLSYDTWIDLVLHINWQTSATGVVEIWKNGTKVFSVSGIRTYPNTSSQIDMDGPIVYTDENPQTITWYLTANRIGDSYAAVAP